MSGTTENFITGLANILEWAFSSQVLVASAIISIIGSAFAIFIGWRVSQSKNISPKWREGIALTLCSIGGLSIAINVARLVLGGLWLW